MKSILSKMCFGCRNIKAIDKFYKDRSKSNYISSRCKDCVDQYQKESRKNPEIKIKKNKYMRSARLNRKKLLIELKGNKCHLCNNSFDEICYDFHHIDQKNKEFMLGRILTYSLEELIKEARKCIMVCANCHRIIHKKEKDAFYE